MFVYVFCYAEITVIQQPYCHPGMYGTTLEMILIHHKPFDIPLTHQAYPQQPDVPFVQLHLG